MAPAALKRLTASAVPVGLLLLLVLISLHLMSSSVQNAEQLTRLFIPLLVASILGLFALVIVVAVNVVQLVVRYRRQAAGSRLTLRMVIIFIILSLAPVAVVYYYSQQFLLQGIDSWFDVQIDRAMEDTLKLSQASLDLHKRETLKTTQRLLAELRDTSVAGLALSMEDLRDKYSVSELTMFDPTGQVVTSVNADPTILVPDQPDDSVLQQVRAGEDYVGLSLQGKEQLLEVRVVLSDRIRGTILQALFTTSTDIAELTETVQGAYNRYKELNFLRDSLKNTFTMTLALVLLFSLLAAIWAAFISARRLVAPIADIAEGTRVVAEGEYGMQLPLPHASDELAFLVASFNTMTRRIAKARDVAEVSQRELEAQHAYLEAVLGRLSSGVMVMGEGGVIRIANRAVGDILRLGESVPAGMTLEQLRQGGSQLEQFADAIQDAVAGEISDWREQISLFGSDGRLVLLCRGTPLAQPGGESAGYVLVFDDVTMLIRAQRDAAWGEVARRLAHEIKNPLTPIQLAAERLRHKYLHKMEGKDAEIMDRATHTIVQQVEAMKEMVNAFSDYARPARIQPEPLSVDHLVTEVLDLYRSAGLKPQLEISLNAESVRVEADPVRLRQVIHNLMKNACEALEGCEGSLIQISTFEKVESECRFVEMQVLDNGCGFDDETLAHLFEPYVTTKVRGTGLGLAVVKKIIEEHGGNIWAENRDGGGAKIVLRLPALGEGSDGLPACKTIPGPDTRRESA
jgi:nitrogen fixation/metabolism regulation signal transduction histidine kinase